LCKKLEAERKNIDIAVDLINKGLKYIFFSKGRLEIIVENDKYNPTLELAMKIVRLLQLNVEEIFVLED